MGGISKRDRFVNVESIRRELVMFHVADLRIANEFFAARIEWPCREFKPLEVGEVRRQSIVPETGNDDWNDVALP